MASMKFVLLLAVVAAICSVGLCFRDRPTGHTGVGSRPGNFPGTPPFNPGRHQGLPPVYHGRFRRGFFENAPMEEMLPQGEAY
uniref:Secreted protein n=1 Tax=Pristhesancus plagipennis TaxID=1955184 RepID=A0A2K8JM96_PRIPG|nr:secreted hypothetical protein [Pristhesancus plagipennis]